MKLTFVYPKLNFLRGGEIHLCRVINTFVDRGHKCRIVTDIFNRDVPKFAELLNRGVEVYETGYTPHKNPWRDRLGSHAGIEDWLIRNQATTDLVCFVNWPCYWTMLRYPKDTPITCIHLVLEPTLGWVYRPYRKRFWPALFMLHRMFRRKNIQAMKRADLTLCYSEAMKAHLQKYYHRDATPTAFGTDTEFFKPVENPNPDIGLDKNCINILTANKGLEEILPIFRKARSKRPELQLYILNGSVTEDGVHSLTNRKPSTMPELYSAMDMFWLHSPHEPWGFVVMESFACGIPVMAHNSGGPSQTVANDQVGFKYNHIKEALDFLLDQNKCSRLNLSSMSTNVRAHVVKHFKWENIAELYHKLFIECHAKKQESIHD